AGLSATRAPTDNSGAAALAVVFRLSRPSRPRRSALKREASRIPARCRESSGSPATAACETCSMELGERVN
ncbi:MAG: hypothetical protein OXN84_05540, partial [Albidovulum sp.]|nr:hypothetical protein [Albidovulum sp.]